MGTMSAARMNRIHTERSKGLPGAAISAEMSADGIRRAKEDTPHGYGKPNSLFRSSVIKIPLKAMSTSCEDVKAQYHFAVNS